MYAGPSEICVLADKNTDLNQITTSLVSQASTILIVNVYLLQKIKKLLKMLSME